MGLRNKPSMSERDSFRDCRQAKRVTHSRYHSIQGDRLLIKPGLEENDISEGLRVAISF